jgi:hypothetical protein
MKQRQIFAIALIITMMCVGCKKESNDSPSDLGANAAGLYSGTWVVVGIGQVPGTCKVTRVTSTSVNLIISAGGQTTPASPAIAVSDGGGGKIMIAYSDSDGTINGNVTGKTLTLTLHAGAITETFTGTKP